VQRGEAVDRGIHNQATIPDNPDRLGQRRPSAGRTWTRPATDICGRPEPAGLPQLGRPLPSLAEAAWTAPA
jgi:hypothetical protein